MSPPPEPAARSILREPLVHFLAIGAALFAAMSLVHAARRPVVRIDAREVEQLAAYWQAQMQRPPTRAELDGIIQDRIDEELLAREAVRLGLDKDDLIVRRRLAQKMAFAREDAASLAEPDEAALRAYFAKTQARYAEPARVALRQLYFSGDRPDARPAAEAALAKLRAGQGAAGDPFVLPLAYADAAPADLVRDYGEPFAKAVAVAPVGAWIGPLTSPYGLHLVRVEARSAPKPAAFEAVRGEVRDAWLADRRAKAQADYLKTLRRRYRIEAGE